MKRIKMLLNYILPGAFCLCSISVFAQISGDRNAVIKNTVNQPAITTQAQIDALDYTAKQQEVNYFDGLGRPLQQIGVRASNNAKDIITPVAFDEFGRETAKYLPYTDAAGTTYGSIRTNVYTDQAAFYSASNPSTSIAKDNDPYSLTFPESSPFNRPVEAGATGTTWLPSMGHAVKMRYVFNSLNDNVQFWKVTNGAPGSFGTYAATPYNPGELYKLITTDENGKQVIEFKDKEGKIVLKKVQLTAPADNGTNSSGHNGWLNTYYVYDDMGRLRCVLPPNAERAYWAQAGLNINILDGLCFRYEYDGRDRVIMKQVPGAGTTEMVYDQRDRLVMSRDARLTSMGYWNIFKYDNLNRQIKIGLVANTTSRATHQTSADADINYPTLNAADIMQENYFDNYDWITTPAQLGISKTLFTADYSAAFFIFSFNSAPYYAQEVVADYVNVRGKPTGAKVRILGTSTYLHSVIFYDADGRVIQTRGANITGGYDVMTTQYDFSGKVLRTVHRHDKQGTNARFAKVNTIYEYDHVGRLLTLKKKVGGVVRTIASNTYDELGNLKNKDIGEIETQDYEYNIRGWLLGANRNYVKGTANKYFGYDIGYDNPNSIVPPGGYYATYSGDIGGITWRSIGDGEKRKYKFTYDAAHRLMKAEFNQFNTDNNAFDNGAGFDFSAIMGDGVDPNTAYDENGNIKKMTQKGWKVNSSPVIDNLDYLYAGSSNKLAKVTDAANDVNSTLGDFKEPVSTTGDDYAYDANGNLTSDKNKGITSILYTHMNMPYEINIAGKGKITYTYDNLGNKLKKVVVDNTVTPAVTTTWLYIQNFVYKDDVMQFFTHEEGRARYDVSEGTGEARKFDFDYFLKDHLGNVRMVLTEESDVAAYPPATIEDARITDEVKYYDIKTAQIKDKSLISGANAYSSFENKLYKVNGGVDGQKTGLGIVLKVMYGDTISFRAESYYNLPGGGPGSPLTIALTELLTSFAGSSALAGKGISTTDVAGISGNTNALNNLLNTNPGSTTANAHLNWVLFDEQFKYVSGGVDPVQTGGGYKNHTNFINNPIRITKSGYIYIFVSNKSNLDVFFDNLTVTHYKGRILEETHYYPFGLTMAGISSHAIGKIENKIKFQGQELANKEFIDGSGLEWYEFKWRRHDQQIGRFIQIDPLAEKYVHNSTYAFSENKVTTHVELEGLESEIFHKAKKELAGTFQAAANWIDKTFSVGTKTKVETPVTTKQGNTNNVVVTEATTEVKPNVGEPMNYVLTNNTSAGYNGDFVKVETKLEVKLEQNVEITTSAGTGKLSTSVDQQGNSSVGGDVTVKTKRGFDVNATASTSSNGDKKVGAGITVPAVAGTVKVGLLGVSTSNQVSMEMNMGFQQKIDNTRVTNSVFVKIKDEKD